MDYSLYQRLMFVVVVIFSGELMQYFGIQFMIQYCDLFDGYLLLIDHNLSVQCQLSGCLLIRVCFARVQNCPDNNIKLSFCLLLFCLLSNGLYWSTVFKRRWIFDWIQVSWNFQKSEQRSFSAGFPDQFNKYTQNNMSINLTKIFGWVECIESLPTSFINTRNCILSGFSFKCWAAEDSSIPVKFKHHNSSKPYLDLFKFYTEM